MVFESRDKEIFRKILRNHEAFTGIRVVTYCLMSNHFHLLLEVPDRDTLAPLDEEGLMAVLPLLYDGERVESVRQELERARLSGNEAWHREILDRYENFAFGKALLAREPFTGLAKVRLEEQVQDYKDQLTDGMVKEGDPISPETPAPAAPAEPVATDAAAPEDAARVEAPPAP